MGPKNFLLATLVGLAFAVPAWAHHTHAMYEPEQRITLNGTVKEFQWINPHSWLYLIVTNENANTCGHRGGKSSSLENRKRSIRIGPVLSW